MPSDLPIVVFRPGVEEERILLELANELGVSKSRALGYALRQCMANRKVLRVRHRVIRVPIGTFRNR